MYSQGFFYGRDRVLIFFLFYQKRSPGDEVESLTLKNQSFLMILKLSALSNINVKNKTWYKVANIASPKSSLHRSLRAFSIIFFCIK